jgi:hypothetical protein
LHVEELLEILGVKYVSDRIVQSKSEQLVDLLKVSTPLMIDQKGLKYVGVSGFCGNSIVNLIKSCAVVGLNYGNIM